MSNVPCLGEIQIDIPARDDKTKRTANLEVKFSNFVMNLPKNHIKSKTRKLPNLKLSAVYVIEKYPSFNEEAISCMLLINKSINNFEEAVDT